jgi:hypothetical protein
MDQAGDRGLTRTKILKRAGIGAAVWTAPLVASSRARAGDIVQIDAICKTASGGIGGACGDWCTGRIEPFICNTARTCACFFTLSGCGCCRCIELASFSCNAQRCNDCNPGSCPPGYTCMAAPCCFVAPRPVFAGICVRICPKRDQGPATAGAARSAGRR